jgi:hypothetical protein
MELGFVFYPLLTSHTTPISRSQINGKKIGKGCTQLLREGNEIAFGTPHPQPQNGGIEDYREPL